MGGLASTATAGTPRSLSRQRTRTRRGSPVWSLQGHGEVTEPTPASPQFLQRMAKGRRFNPPLDQDGRWFPHIGLPQKTPESITRAMLKEPRSPRVSRQMEGKLPPIYKIREKQADHNSFPFSVHDNRHSFENSGFYLDSGLGLKKVSPEKRQHASRNFNLWACDYVPSCLDGFSSYQISYVYREAVVVPIFRRFPRHYNELWSSFRFIPERSYAEFLKKNPKVRFTVDKKADSSLEP